MKSEKRARLEAAGWKMGSVRDFLGLSRTEAVMIEIRHMIGSLLGKIRAL